MTPSQFLKSVVLELRKRKLRFAVAGGLVTSLYRQELRATADLDLILLADSKTASQVIKSFHLNPSLVRKADFEGGPLFAIKRKSTPPIMVAGRNKSDLKAVGLDFLLPEVPWFDHALQRSIENQYDFGFGQVPCLTVEDIIVAKLMAYQNNNSRFKDLDDLQSVFLANHKLDLDYIYGRMCEFKLKIPASLKEVAPSVLKRAHKKI